MAHKKKTTLAKEKVKEVQEKSEATQKVVEKSIKSEKKGINKIFLFCCGFLAIVFLCAICALISYFVYKHFKDKDSTLYSSNPSVDITFPTGSNWYTSYDSSVELSGIAYDEEDKIKKVEWKIEGGDKGTADGTENWKTEKINLEEGDNKITVTVTDNSGKRGEDSIFIVYNKEIVFVNDLKLTPDHIFKDDPEVQVIFRTQVVAQSNNTI